MGYDIKTEGSGVYGFWFWNGELGFRRFLSEGGVAFGTVEKPKGSMYPYSRYLSLKVPI